MKKAPKIKKELVKTLGTSQLMTYQQILGLANEQMDRFATDMDEMSKRDNAVISERFAQEVSSELQPRVEANNKILSEIEKEIYSRVTRDFNEATTPNIIGAYVKRFHGERERLLEIAKKVADIREVKEEKVRPKLKLEE